MRNLSIAICLLFSSSLFGSVDHNPKQLPVFAFSMNYDCPNCKETYEKKIFLEQACKSQTANPVCVVQYLPFISSKSDSRAGIYYTAREHSHELAEKVNDTFFTYETKGPLSTEESITLLSTMVPEFNWADFIPRFSSGVGGPAIKKVANIMDSVAINDYPSFILITADSMKLIPVPINPKLRLEAAIQYVRENIK